ncbi:BC1872 family protein [Brevibacillus sp. 179-C9.3 HS]|uniref:BC1872 family protein n=1 Tax=unclassified Brevibacillus TaxID=2684853 RepID=UPI0039A1F649
MTEQQLVETLATKVMGWEKGTNFYNQRDYFYGFDDTWIWASEWNPLQNIADAWHIVDKLVSNGWLYELSNERRWFQKIHLGWELKET